jgi:hypothetical protein
MKHLTPVRGQDCDLVRAVALQEKVPAEVHQVVGFKGVNFAVRIQILILSIKYYMVIQLIRMIFIQSLSRRTCDQ